MTEPESIHRRLERIRPPRVQLSYDVQVGDAQERRAIPFVVGVLGDFAGDPDAQAATPRLRDRSFVAVDRDNLGDVMRGIGPRATLALDVPELPALRRADLSFECLADFRPESIVRQVPELAELAALRARLSDLRNALAGSDRLEDALDAALAHTQPPTLPAVHGDDA